MSTAKKIYIAIALFIVLAGSLWAYIVQHPLKKSSGTKTIKKIVMKCGVGKCGAAMMEEIDVQVEDKPAKSSTKQKVVKKIIMKCGTGKCGAAMMEEVEVPVKEAD